MGTEHQLPRGQGRKRVGEQVELGICGGACNCCAGWCREAGPVEPTRAPVVSGPAAEDLGDPEA